MSETGRYEIKFVLDEESKYTDALRWLNTCLPSRRSYPGRSVQSIYFDDPEFNSVKDNLTGISDRRKLRLRWYHMGPESSTPKLELKIKNGRLGFKRHFELHPLASDISCLKFNEIAKLVRENIIEKGAVEHIFCNHLSPSLYVNYYRDYFEAPYNIRITIDSNITYSLADPFLSIADSAEITTPSRILEIKFPPSSKDEVSQLMSELHLIPTRHSKYLMGLARHGLIVY